MFIDYTAAFDTVSHKFLDEALGKAGASNNPERDAGHNRMRSRNNTCSGSRGTGANRRRSVQRAGARQRRRSSNSSSTDRNTPVE